MPPVTLSIVGLLLLAACSPGAPPPSPEELAADPVHLKLLTQACRDHRGPTSAADCASAAQAERLRFMHGGHPTYTPEEIDGTTARSKSAR